MKCRLKIPIMYGLVAIFLYLAGAPVLLLAGGPTAQYNVIV